MAANSNTRILAIHLTEASLGTFYLLTPSNAGFIIDSLLNSFHTFFTLFLHFFSYYWIALLINYSYLADSKHVKTKITPLGTWLFTKAHLA